MNPLLLIRPPPLSLGVLDYVAFIVLLIECILLEHLPHILDSPSKFFNEYLGALQL